MNRSYRCVVAGSATRHATIWCRQFVGRTEHKLSNRLGPANIRENQSVLSLIGFDQRQRIHTIAGLVERNLGYETFVHLAAFALAIKSRCPCYLPRRTHRPTKSHLYHQWKRLTRGALAVVSPVHTQDIAVSGCWWRSRLCDWVSLQPSHLQTFPK